MNKNSKNLSSEIEEIFSRPPSVNQKAWGILNEFYHLILSHMEQKNISKADLAKRLNRSRSAVSQMFNKTPNITIRKMVEIANSIGLDISLVPSQIKKEMSKRREQEYKVLLVDLNHYRTYKSSGMPMKIVEDDNYKFACGDLVSCKDWLTAEGKEEWQRTN